MKFDKILRIFLIVISLLILQMPSFGQKQQKAQVITIKISVADEEGQAIPFSTIISSRKRCRYTADDKGEITISVPSSDILTTKAKGYETVVTNAFKNTEGELRITLKKNLEQEGEENMLYVLPNDYISERRVIGAYSKISGEELEENPTMSLMEGMSGRLNGLFYRANSRVPGFNSWEGFVRAPSGGSPIILVDGVQRSLQYLEPETIESVELLKDASLKSMFGGIRSNGILLVKTKRGKANENSVRINFQTGAQISTHLPEYLNSYEYTTLYNQALNNVGAKAIYDPSKYDGSNPILYPDVDYYKEFLKKSMQITRINGQLTGGNENTKYFVNLGYQENGGLQKYTDYPNEDKVFSVRGNVDNTLFDFINFHLGINAAIESVKFPVISGSDFIDILSTNRPNEFAIKIPGSMVGLSDEYVLGGTSVRRNNPLGQLTQNGFVDREFSYMQSDMSVDIILDKWIKGLSIRPAVTFDFYNEMTKRKDQDFSVYELYVNQETDEIEGYKEWGLASQITKLVQGETNVNRNWVFSNTVKYDRVFNEKHKLTAFAMAYLQKRYFTGIHNLKRVNLGIGANYMYDNTYILDVSANYVGVPSFAKSERFRLFPTIGLGWVMTENDFLKQIDWLDFLKLKASFGVLGSTNASNSTYYYRDEWTPNGSYSFSSLANRVELSQTGNPDIGFQKSYETNLGMDFELFHNSLSGSFVYFNNYLNGLISDAGSSIPNIIGDSGALIYFNCKDYLSQGVEASLNYSKRFNNLLFSLGGNISYGISDCKKDINIAYPDELSMLRKVKRDGDIKGYRVIGTFESEEDIASSALQPFGNVYPGDLKYKDSNSDGIIDAKDKEIIANTTPSVQYGINLSLEYKGFNLDLLGYGLAGFSRMLTTKYYQIYGGRKYSKVVVDGLPNGKSHPILRADNSQNNFQTSDYWVVDGGFFKLRNAELGYSLPLKLVSKIHLSGLKIYVRGSNLFTISKIKDLDPEYLSAGVSDYPLFTTITGGLSLTF